LVIEYDDATIGLWNVASAEEEQYLQSQQRNSVISLAFSHSGKRVATIQENNIVNVWDLHLGDVPTILKSATPVRTMAFSPDGTLLAIVQLNKIICVWDTSSGQQTTLLQVQRRHRLYSLAGANKNITCVEFSPDGHQIAWGCDDETVHLWDLKQGVEIISVPKPRISRGVIFSVVFSPDGVHVLYACGRSELCNVSIWLWNTMSNRVSHLQTLKKANYFFMKFSPDGLHIKIAQAPRLSERNIEIWNHSGGCLIKSRNYLHHKCVLRNPIIITPDTWIVHVETGTILGKLPSIVSVRCFTAFNTSIAFTTEDHPSTLITMHFSHTKLTSQETWNPATYEEVSSFKHDFYCVSSASDGHNTDDSDSDHLAVD
jgi:WD40 repeat protein